MNEIIIRQDYAPDMIDFMKNAGRIANSELDLAPGPDELPDPVKAAFERGPIAAALAKSGVHVYASLDLSVPKSDVDEDTLELDKGLTITVGDPTRTFAKRTRPVVAKRTVQTDSNGFRWVKTFDLAGALLDCKVLLSDGD
jgi:hypothetical protein